MKGLFLVLFIVALTPVRGLALNLETQLAICSQAIAGPDQEVWRKNMVLLNNANIDIEAALINLRNPFVPIKDLRYLKNYLKNYKHATEVIFLPSYKDGSVARNYEAVMRAEHVVMTRGLRGNSEYDGYYSYGSTVGKLSPGVFSFDPKYLEGLLTGGLASPGAQMQYFSVLTLPFVNEETAQFNLDFLKGKPDSFKVEIEGIPEDQWPLNYVDGGMSDLRPDLKNYKHNYPILPFMDPMTGRRLYFERAKVLMKGIVEAKDEVQKIDLLADYYNVAEEGHFYPWVNNSILMGQVNTILSLMGYELLPHQLLDYRSLFMSTSEFRKYLRSILIKKPKLISP